MLNDASDCPIWIYIHGGRWQLFDKNMSCHMVRPLIESGIRPVIADFDIIPAGIYKYLAYTGIVFF